MISITCTSCKNVLTIDDAFAGGVCRCQYCGTIQTVPSSMKGSAQRIAGAKVVKVKALYHGSVSPGSGLDELADVVASSSGLGDPSLRRHRPDPTAAPPAIINGNIRAILIAAGAIFAALIVIIILLLTRSNSSNPSPSPGSDGGTPNTPAGGTYTPAGGGSNIPSKPPLGPTIAGIPLSGNVVIYLIDNGSYAGGVHEKLSAMSAECLQSAQSLGPERKFAIIYWRDNSGAYPADGRPVAASTDHVNAARDALQDVTAGFETNVQTALAQALKANPTDIVLISAKPGDKFDRKWLDGVKAQRGSSPVRIHAVHVGSDSGGMLSRLAADTGGKFAVLDVH